MPRKSIFSNLTVEIPKGCDIDKKRLYVYYRKNSIRRHYKDKLGTYPDHERVCVGKAIQPSSPNDGFELMVPNANFPDVLFNILKSNGSSDEEAAEEIRKKFGISFPFTEGTASSRVSIKSLLVREENNYFDHVCIGIYTSFNVIARDCGLMEDLFKAFGEKDALTILDLAQYMLSARSAVFQHFPHWAKSHLLFNDHLLTDSYISEFISTGLSMSKINFYKKLWARRCIDTGKLTLSYDSTNVGSQADGVALVEKGHAKDDPSLDQINTEYVIRQSDGVPVTYSEYPGSINDIKEAKKMISFLGEIVSDVNKSRKEMDLARLCVTVICDRGYISEQNVIDLDDAEIGFLLMLRKNMSITDNILNDNIGIIKRPENYISKYDIYCKTIKMGLFHGDTKLRYFHIIWNPELEASHRKLLYSNIERMEMDLNKAIERKLRLTDSEIKKYTKYFILSLRAEGIIAKEKAGNRHEKRNITTYIITSASRNNENIYTEDQKCGHYILVSSEEMTAVQAYENYIKRGGIEKVFSTLKSQLGMDKYGVHSDNAVRGKTLVWFIASILYSLIQVKTNSLYTSNRKLYTAPCILDYLEEYETDFNLETCRYELRYTPTRRQDLVFKALGIENNDFERSVKKIEFKRAKT